MRFHEAHAWLACIPLSIAACTHSQETTPARADPAPAIASVAPAAQMPMPPSASPTASAPPPPQPTATAHVAAWTDSNVVAELAKDCRYSPVREKDQAGPLSCALEFEQSCVPDPCFDEAQACKPACAKTCTSCSAKCTTACASCKSACKADDTACAERCATTCGACRQDCVTSKDRCTTGTCGAVFQNCRKKVAAEWKAGDCTAACPKIVACTEACGNEDEPKKEDACRKGCRRHLGKCPPKFFVNCEMGADPSL